MVADRRNEAGYTLVALLALMSLMALFAMTAAPRLRQQAQRERETEAIYRGEQMAEAIRLYYLNHTGAPAQRLPNNVEQLMEGIQRGTRKVQILRPSAARDTNSSSGEWRLVAPLSQELLNFEESVMIYAGGLPPRPRDTTMASLQDYSVPRLTSVLNTQSTEPPPGGEDTSTGTSGPFVGVASRSRRASVLYFYGIDRHDHWIFTPLFR